MLSAERVYKQHRDAIQVLAAFFIGGGVVVGPLVTRSDMEASTTALSQQIASVSQKVDAQAQAQAVTAYQVKDQGERLARVEVTVGTLVKN